MYIIIRKLLSNKLLQKTLKLSAISMGANVLGFLIPIYIAYKYSVSKSTDDFFLSYSIITFVGVIFSGAIRAVVIPFLKERRTVVSDFEVFISTIFYFCIKYIGLLSVLLFLGFLSGFLLTNKTAYLYVCLSVPIVFFTVLNSFCYGILNSLDQFYLAEMSPFSRAVIIFLTIFLFGDSLGLVAVILGYNLGEVFKFFHLMYVVKVKNQIKISLKEKDFSIIRTFFKQGAFQVFSTTLSSASPLVDRFIASFLIIGSISILDYGDRVFMIFNVLLNSFLVVILSKWAGDFANNTFKFATLRKSLLSIFIVSTLAFIVISFTYSEIINLLYPKVKIEDRNYIGLILLINMAGFIFNSMNQVINRATIAFKATKIMVTTSIVRTVANIILDIIFAKFWGVLGIAIATVVVHIIAFGLNYILFDKHYKRSLATL